MAGAMFSGLFGKPNSPGERALQLATQDDDDDKPSGKSKGGKGTGLFDPSGLERYAITLGCIGTASHSGA